MTVRRMKELFLYQHMQYRKKQKKFLALYEPNHQHLQRYCESILKDPVEAKDLVSETVLLAYERLDSLRKEKSFRYFLFGIARNLIRRQQRRKKFWGVFNTKKAEQISAKTQKAMNPDVQLLYQALDQLPENQKEAIILFELVGYKIKEIAEIQATSISNVKQRLARGRKKLSHILSPTTVFAHE